MPSQSIANLPPPHLPAPPLHLPGSATAATGPTQGGIHWPLAQLATHVWAHHHVSWPILWAQVMDIAAAVVFAAKSLSAILFAHQQPSPETCFEMFGIDVLVDNSFWLYLLGAYSCPSPGCAADIDKAGKYPMLSD